MIKTTIFYLITLIFGFIYLNLFTLVGSLLPIEHHQQVAFVAFGFIAAIPCSALSTHYLISYIKNNFDIEEA